jgi:hypothetical protein
LRFPIAPSPIKYQETQEQPSHKLFRIKQQAISVSKLAEVGDQWKKWDVIGIDEGQFYPDVSSDLL